MFYTYSKSHNNFSDQFYCVVKNYSFNFEKNSSEQIFSFPQSVIACCYTFINRHLTLFKIAFLKAMI